MANCLYFGLLSAPFRRLCPAESRYFALGQLRSVVLVRIGRGVRGFGLPSPVFRQGGECLVYRIRYIRATCLGLPEVAWWAMG